jgi:hypothetical protein
MTKWRGSLGTLSCPFFHNFLNIELNNYFQKFQKSGRDRELLVPLKLWFLMVLRNN